jgi:hypothetical protein
MPVPFFAALAKKILTTAVEKSIEKRIDRDDAPPKKRKRRKQKRG